MPIYEYVCKSCGSKFEKLILSSNRARQVHCPECSSSTVEKTISLFGTSGSDLRGGSDPNCAPSG